MDNIACNCNVLYIMWAEKLYHKMNGIGIKPLPLNIFNFT